MPPCRDVPRLPLVARLAIALTLMAAAAMLALSSAPRAEASSDGAMVVSPLTGGAGTHVTIDIHIFADSTASYELRYTTTAPDQGGCTSSRPLPVSGVNPFQAGGSAAGMVEFNWPASLGSDRYYFCAYPASSGTPAPGVTPSPTAAPPFQTGERARSLYPFTVLYDTTPQIVFSPPADGVPLGSIIGVQINDWRSGDHQAPSHVWLVTVDGYSWYVLQFRVLSAPDANGTTTLKVTLPTALPSNNFTSPASFFLVAGSPGICQDSAPFQVTPVLSSTATITPILTRTSTPTAIAVASGHEVQVDAGSPLIVLFAGLTALIALGLVAAVIALAMRGRADGRRREMRQMGLEVEPLEPAGMRDAPRPGMRQDTSRWDDRGWDHRSR